MTAGEGAARRAPVPADLGAEWIRAMRRGDFETAWAVSDHVLAARAGRSCSHLPRHEQWVWDGRPLDGRRVLVRCHHGLGDTIQFIRLVPLLAARTRSVAIWAQPALVPLLHSLEGVGALHPLHDGAPDIDRDADVEVMELPHILRTTLRTIPASCPYLHADPAPFRSGTGLQVGLAWHVSDWGRERSIPFTALLPLTRVAGVALHALQRGPALAECPPEAALHSGRDDVMAAARVMRALDLVISVDSFPAHLAGALGVPVWTLLQRDADWRWMDAREDSPWYPTMRLFRQRHTGDWEEVVARVAAALRTLASERGQQ